MSMTNYQTYKPPQNDAEARRYVMENYGWMAYFLKDGELGPILLKAGYGQWDAAKVEGAIKNTNWWRSKNDAQRKYAMLEAEDPTELIRQRQHKTAIVNDAAHRLGIGGDFDIGQFADDAMEFGWSDEQIMDMLSWSISMDDTKKPGQVATWFGEMKAMAAQYYIRIADSDLLADAQRIARGERTVEDMEAYYRQLAKQKFGYLAETLDQGVTVAQYFAPHRAELANILEVGEDSIDLMNDQRYHSVLYQADPNADGRQRAMTLAEVGEFARKDERWKATSNARETSASMVSALTEVFGARAR
jgi:hypothetical protein